MSAWVQANSIYTCMFWAQLSTMFLNIRTLYCSWISFVHGSYWSYCVNLVQNSALWTFPLQGQNKRPMSQRMWTVWHRGVCQSTSVTHDKWQQETNEQLTRSPVTGSQGPSPWWHRLTGEIAEGSTPYNEGVAAKVREVMQLAGALVCRLFLEVFLKCCLLSDVFFFLLYGGLWWTCHSENIYIETCGAWDNNWMW